MSVEHALSNLTSIFTHCDASEEAETEDADEHLEAEGGVHVVCCLQVLLLIVVWVRRSVEIVDEGEKCRRRSGLKKIFMFDRSKQRLPQARSHVFTALLVRHFGFDIHIEANDTITALELDASMCFTMVA